MQSPSLNFICPRLLDYLVIVGRSETISPSIPKHIPQLLNCYPNTSHKDFELPKEVVFFCQPDGCLSSDRCTADLGPESFIFTLTDKDTGKVRFGISLNFFRLIPELQNDKQLDKENRKNVQESTGTTENRTSLTTLCLISHHPFFSKFRKCLHLLKHLIDSAQLFLDHEMVPSHPGQIWSLITGALSPATADPVCQRIFSEIETWIFRLLSTPAPLPERSCVYLSVVPDTLEPPLVFALPDKTRLTLVDFPLHLPLELLGVETCLKVLTAIMLEQKVILQSRDYNSLTMSVMAFTAMLYPLQYMFPAIPLLPTSLDGAENLLLSPTPFLIGIPATFLSQKKTFFIPPDVWLVDLDANRMMGSSRLESLPPLPPQEGHQLVQHLENALTSMTSKHRGPSNERTLAEDEQATGDELKNAVDDVDAVDVATRVAMVRFFNSPNVLANLSEHTRTIRLYPRPVVAFQYYSFLKSRQKLTPFIRRLAQTQAVEFLAEWSIYPENEVFQRIHAGITDAALIGDKAKWFANVLPHIPFDIWLKGDFSWLEAALQFFPGGEVRRPSTIPLPEPVSHYSPPMTVEEQLQHAMLPKVAVRTRKKRRPGLSATRSIDSTYNTSTNQPIDARSLATQATIEPFPTLTGSSPESSSDLDDTDIWDLKRDVETGEKVSQQELQQNDSTPIGDKQPHSPTTSSRLSSQNTDDVPKNSLHANGQAVKSPMIPTDKISVDEPFSASKKLKGLRKIGAEFFTMKTNSTESNEQQSAIEEALTRNKSVEESEEDDLEEAFVGKVLFSNLTENLSEAASQASSTLTGLLRTPKQLVRRSEKFARSVVTDFKSESSPKKPTLPGVNSSASESQSTYQAVSDALELQHVGLPRKTPEQNSSDQAFLRDLVVWVIGGRNLSSSIRERLRELLVDENYRSYLMSKLNLGLVQPITDPGEGLQDVALQSQSVFNAFVAVLHCMVRGLETTCTNHGIGGLASAMLMLEMCHTHYLEQQPKQEQKSTTAQLQKSSTDKIAVNEVEDNFVDTLTGWFRSTANELRPTAKLSPDPKSRDPGLGRKLTGKVTGIFSRANRLFSSNELESHNKKSLNPSIQEVQEPHDVDKASTTASAGTSTRGSLTSAGSLVPSSDEQAASMNQTSSPVAVQRYDSVKGQLIQETISPVETSKPNTLNRRTYLYEMLVQPNHRSRLWDHMQFWEDMFFDVVAQERDILGLDQAPVESLEKFTGLNPIERKILQNTEDRLLSTCLHNLIAYLVMMRVDKATIRSRVRRIQARCRLQSIFSETLSKLLDRLDHLEGNSIRLLPSATRQPCIFSAEVRRVGNLDEPGIIQVYPSYILLRNLTDAIIERRSFSEQFNVKLSEDGEKVVFLIQGDGTGPVVDEFYCTKAKQAVSAIQVAMNMEPRPSPSLLVQ